MLNNLIFIGSIFSALTTIYILFFKQNALKSFSGYILTLYFICQIWSVVLFLVLFNGFIVSYPHLYKTASPLNFIVPPLTYLYVRVVLFNKKATKIDLLHFVLFIIALINYFPFYFLNTADKLSIINQIVKDYSQTYKLPIGYISEPILNLSKLLQLVVYQFFQWRLIYKYRRKNDDKNIQDQIKAVLKWLEVFSSITTITTIAYLTIAFFVLIHHPLDYSLTIQIPVFVLAVGFFIISAYILTHPHVLTGLPFVKYKEVVSPLFKNEVEEVPFIKENYSEQIKGINDFFISSQPYLKQNITLAEVAIMLNLNVRELSYIINNYYKKRFTDFVNSYRLAYVIEQFKAKSDMFTMESIALEAGFSSKSNFYRAFTKEFNQSPTEYFKSIND